MLIRLESADTENTSPIKYFGVGETAVFITNHDTLKCQRNFATGAIENAVVGGPAITEDMAAFKAMTNCVQTAFAESDILTVFSIFCPHDPLSFAVSNYAGAADSGFGLWVQASNQLQFFASRDNGSGAPLLASASADILTLGNWLLASGVAAAASNTVTNHTSVHTATLANSSPRIRGTNKARVGSCVSGTFTGAADHLITVIAPAVLTPAQTASVLGDLRAYATKHGITV